MARKKFSSPIPQKSEAGGTPPKIKISPRLKWAPLPRRVAAPHVGQELLGELHGLFSNIDGTCVKLTKHFVGSVMDKAGFRDRRVDHA